jgi:hypothetical protein
MLRDFGVLIGGYVQDRCDAIQAEIWFAGIAEITLTRIFSRSIQSNDRVHHIHWIVSICTYLLVMS